MRCMSDMTGRPRGMAISLNLFRTYHIIKIVLAIQQNFNEKISDG